MAKQELSRKIYSSKDIEKMDKKLKLLGRTTKLKAIPFLNFRFFTSIIIFFVLLYTSDFGYVAAPLGTIIYFYLLGNILITSKTKLRRAKMESEAMHFFEVLTLSLETGRNLEQAFLVTTTSVSGELSNEFKEALRQVKYGKSLTESLTDTQNYIPSEAINNIIVTLTQSDLFGNSIIDTMYNQIDYLREKRKMEVKADISKVPIKISIISVIFFVPLILLIILGPVLISYLS